MSAQLPRSGELFEYSDFAPSGFDVLPFRQFPQNFGDHVARRTKPVGDFLLGQAGAKNSDAIAEYCLAFNEYEQSLVDGFERQTS